MIEGLQKSAPIVLLISPFVKKFLKQLDDFKEVCIFVFAIFFYQTNIELPAGYFARSDLDYLYKHGSKLDCSLLKGYRLYLPT